MFFLYHIVTTIFRVYWSLHSPRIPWWLILSYTSVWALQTENHPPRADPISGNEEEGKAPIGHSHIIQGRAPDSSFNQQLLFSQGPPQLINSKDWLQIQTSRDSRERSHKKKKKKEKVLWLTMPQTHYAKQLHNLFWIQECRKPLQSLGVIQCSRRTWGKGWTIFFFSIMSSFVIRFWFRYWK